MYIHICIHGDILSVYTYMCLIVYIYRNWLINQICVEIYQTHTQYIASGYAWIVRSRKWSISFEWEKSHPTWRFSYEILISSGLPKVSQMRTTVLEYLPTKLGHKNGVNVSKYSSTMEHLGLRMVHAEKIRVSMNKFLGWNYGLKQKRRKNFVLFVHQTTHEQTQEFYHAVGRSLRGM